MKTTEMVEHCIAPDMRKQRELLLTSTGPRGFYEIVDLRERRERYAAAMALGAFRRPSESVVRHIDQTVARSNKPDLAVRIYRPSHLVGSAPVIVYFHGGGFVLGSVQDEDPVAAMLARDVDCVVVSVEYGLAPENPGTGPAFDCYDALCWAAAHADEFGGDPGKVALYGGSAGGGLACAVSLMARDFGGPTVLCQVLAYPMIDDRDVAVTNRDLVLGIWDLEANLESWRLLLGDSVGTEGVSPYAVPARAAEFAGLPPTYLDVGDLDLFLDEDLALARALEAEGVEVELHIRPGAYHGFDLLAPSARLSHEAVAARVAALRRAFAPSADRYLQGRRLGTEESSL